MIFIIIWITAALIITMVDAAVQDEAGLGRALVWLLWPFMLPAALVVLTFAAAQWVGLYARKIWAALAAQEGQR